MTEKPNTLYQPILLPLPEIMGQGNYKIWKEDAAEYGWQQNYWNSNFSRDIEIHVSVSSRFDGSLTALLIWIETLFKDMKIINGRGEIKVAIIEIANDCSDISVKLYDIERNQETGLVAA